MFTSHNAAAIDAALSHFGIIRVLSYQVHDQLVSGELQELLPNREYGVLPVNLVHSDGKNASAKIRQFVELAVEDFRSIEVLNY